MIRDIKYDSNRVMSSKLFIMVPHSGRNYEKKFLKLTKVRLSELRKSEDCFVDLIFKDLKLKFNFLSANFPRIFVDVNSLSESPQTSLTSSPSCSTARRAGA